MDIDMDLGIDSIREEIVLETSAVSLSHKVILAHNFVVKVLFTNSVDIGP